MSPPRNLSDAVLVVAHDADLRDAIRQFLEVEGYGVVCAANGAEAVACLSGVGAPAAVVFELEMPVMDGVEFHAALRGTPGLRAVPAFAIAGDARAPALDGVSVLREPLDPSALLARLKASLARR